MPDFSTLPTKAIRASMERYIEEGYHPGSFLLAILSNDLRASYLKNNGRWEDVANILEWLQEEAPAVCWGSEECVMDWLNKPWIRVKAVISESKNGIVIPIDIRAMDVVK